MIYGVHSTYYTATAAISTLLDAFPRSRIRPGEDQARLRPSRSQIVIVVYNQRSSSWYTPLLYSNSVSRVFWRITCRYLILYHISPSFHFSMPRHNDKLDNVNVPSYLSYVSRNSFSSSKDFLSHHVVNRWMIYSMLCIIICTVCSSADAYMACQQDRIDGITTRYLKPENVLDASFAYC